MATILGISGSLRAKSFNTMLLDAASRLLPAGTTLTIGSIRGIPLYDGDLEDASGIPPAAEALKDQIAAADGVLIASPEYNNSLPGVLKNAIDWCSRPSRDIAKVFGGKKVAIMGTSPGPWGAGLAQVAWLPVLRTLGTNPWFGGRLTIPRADSVFDAAGEITDEKVRGQLEKFITGFARFVATRDDAA